jgi:hypothetical protein
MRILRRKPRSSGCDQRAAGAWYVLKFAVTARRGNGGSSISSISSISSLHVCRKPLQLRALASTRARALCARLSFGTADGQPALGRGGDICVHAVH